MMFDYITAPDSAYGYTAPESAYEYVVDMQSIETPLHVIAEEHLTKYTGGELDRNWGLQDFFDSIIVINLPKATERLENFTEELQSIGTTSFDRFVGIDGSTEVPPSIWQKFYLNRCNVDLSTETGQKIFTRIRKREAGCYLSHMGVYQKVKRSFDSALKNLQDAEEGQDESRILEAKAQVDRSSRALIFEDDACFGFLQGNDVTKEGVGQLFNEALAQVPDDWDILYLFVYPTEPTVQITDHIQQIFGSWCLPAYVIRYTIYEDLVREFEKLYDPEVTKVATNDLTFAAFQRTRKAYAIRPSVVYHAGGESMITGEVFEPYQAVSEFAKENVIGIPKPGYPPIVKTVYELND